MPYAIQTEWMLTMEALRYVLYFVSTVTLAGFVVYLIGIFVLCRNEVRPSRRRAAPSRTVTMRLGAARAAMQ